MKRVREQLKAVLQKNIASNLLSNVLAQYACDCAMKCDQYTASFKYAPITLVDVDRS